MKYYACGGHYGDHKEFKLVRPSGKNPPYITTEEFKDRLFNCSRHHSDLYEINMVEEKPESITKIRNSWWEYENIGPDSPAMTDDLKEEILWGIKNLWKL